MVFQPEARVEFQEFALVVFRRQDVARTGMRHQAHEQVVIETARSTRPRTSAFREARASA